MTADEWEAAGVPLPNEQPETVLMANAALDWIGEHTSLDIENPKAFPSGAKLFVLKYIACMSQSFGVTSESLAGMSQSFDASDKGGQLMQYARELMGQYLNSDIRFVPAESRWV